LSLLTEGYEKAGQPEKGLKVLAEALEEVSSGGEQVEEAEIYRLKGHLVLQSGGRRPEAENPSSQPLIPNTQEAEAYFLKAIEIARKKQARAFELRSVMSLCRLWQRQSKQHAARNMLSEIYGWFTEGLET